MKIAVLGPKGTFSDKAYLEYNKFIKAGGSKGYEPVYCQTIDDVFKAVCSDDSLDVTDECEFGIVPIENTLDGYVQRTLDLLLEKNVRIIDENIVPVQFSVIGNVSSVEDITKLYVQFKANGQCRQFINSLSGVTISATDSNMESYYKIEGEIGAAAIVPKHIADDENDRFVIENVTDADKNHTRFVIFKKGALKENEMLTGKLDIAGECDCASDVTQSNRARIPVYIMPDADRPGILFEILQSFYENQINLISIMSRPTKHKMGTYNFYIEIDGEISRLPVIMDTLQKVSTYNKIKILGIYNE